MTFIFGINGEKDARDGRRKGTWAPSSTINSRTSVRNVRRAAAGAVIRLTYFLYQTTYTAHPPGVG